MLEHKFSIQSLQTTIAIVTVTSILIIYERDKNLLDIIKLGFEIYRNPAFEQFEYFGMKSAIIFGSELHWQNECELQRKKKKLVHSI